tara:strand:+ start:7 stop:273 length:267 start_codon:yes stop_codon:yes gene_type:complete
MRNLRQVPMTDHQSQWNGPQQTEASRKPIRNQEEFVEALKAGLRARGIEPSPDSITIEEPMSPSSPMRYGVIFRPRRPRPKNDNKKEI